MRIWMLSGVLVSCAGMLWGCGASSQEGVITESALYGPSALAQPFVPDVAMVDPKRVERLGLEQMLVFADTHSPMIKVARAKADRSQGAVEDAKVVLPQNPQASFGVGARRVGGASGLDVEASVSQAFEVFGEVGLRRDAAAAKQVLAKATEYEVRWFVHVQVHRMYSRLLLLKEQQKQAQSFVAFSQVLNDTASRQVEAGETSPLTLLVSQTDVSQAKAALIRVKQSQRQTQVRLATLMGWPVEVEFPKLEGSLPDVVAPPSVASLLALMAKHHPSIRTRELAVVARQQELALAKKEVAPHPALGVSYAREAAPGVGAGPAANIWMASLSVPIPLWQRNQGDVARAHADLTASKHQRQQQYMQLRGDILHVLAAIDAAVERVRMFETGIIPKLEQNLGLLQKAYEIGEVNVSQVSQTRQQLLTATQQYIDARMTYFESVALLEGLIGTEL